MTEQIYIIGTKPRPRWTYERLYTYRHMDGSTGWEWWYPDGRILELKAGDTLVYYAGRVYPRYR